MVELEQDTLEEKQVEIGPNNENRITELTTAEKKQLYIDTINIIDTATEQITGISRDDPEFYLYESWAFTDIKNELQAEIGKLEVELTNTNKPTI